MTSLVKRREVVNFRNWAKTCKGDRPPSKAITIFLQFWNMFSYVDIVAKTCKSMQKR